MMTTARAMPATGSIGRVTNLRPLRRLIWIGADKFRHKPSANGF